MCSQSRNRKRLKSVRRWFQYSSRELNFVKGMGTLGHGDIGETLTRLSAIVAEHQGQRHALDSAIHRTQAHPWILTLQKRRPVIHVSNANISSCLETCDTSVILLFLITGMTEFEAYGIRTFAIGGSEFKPHAQLPRR